MTGTKKVRGEDWVKVMKTGFLAFYGLLKTQAVVQNNLSVYLKRHQEHITKIQFNMHRIWTGSYVYLQIGS